MFTPIRCDINSPSIMSGWADDIESGAHAFHVSFHVRTSFACAPLSWTRSRGR